MGIWDFATSGLWDFVYLLTLGLFGTSRPFDFWTLGLYDFSTSGILDPLVCRRLDCRLFHFGTLVLWDFYKLWHFGLWDFGTFRLLDFETSGLWDFSTF